MTEGEKVWFDHYLETGDGNEAVAIGFPDCAERNRPVRAAQLKRKFENEIDSHLTAQYKKDAPQMVRLLRDLATGAKQEAVKLKAITDWLSRAGHDAAFKVEHSEKPQTLEELQNQVLAAMSALSPEESKGVIDLLIKNGQVDQVHALMNMTTENPQ